MADDSVVLSVLAQENWHVHTTVSRCAKPEMTVRNIIAAADAAGLRTIALVDHHHSREHDILADIARLREEAEAVRADVKVVVGAELSAFGGGRYSDSIETNRRIDFRLYACNHYHVSGWEHPETCSGRAYAEHGLGVLRELLPSGRADAIAHPFVGTYLAHKLPDTRSVTETITDSELGDILELGKKHRVAWEINPKAVAHDPPFARRMWRVGREIEVEFLFGTDAHILAAIDPRQYVEDVSRRVASGAQT